MNMMDIKSSEISCSTNTHLKQPQEIDRYRYLCQENLSSCYSTEWKRGHHWFF